MSRTVGATSPRARRTGSPAANRPSHRAAPDTDAVGGSRANDGLLATLQVAPERAGHTRSVEAALVYLHSSRLFTPVPRAPLSPEEMNKLAESQANVMVDVIEAVLAGLKLSPEQYEHGRKLASEVLAAVAAEGWAPR